MATTYQELLEAKRKLEQQQAELERKIAETQKAEKAGAVEKVKAMMAEYGLTVEDLQEANGRRGRKPGAVSPVAGKSVAAKYRDDRGNSWSGRGLQPRWLKAAIAEGKSLQDFAV